MAGVLVGKSMAHLDLGVTLVIVVGGFDVAQRVVDSAQGVVVRLARGGGDSGEVKLVGARLQRGRLPPGRAQPLRQFLARPFERPGFASMTKPSNSVLDI